MLLSNSSILFNFRMQKLSILHPTVPALFYFFSPFLIHLLPITSPQYTASAMINKPAINLSQPAPTLSVEFSLSWAPPYRTYHPSPFVSLSIDAVWTAHYPQHFLFLSWLKVTHVWGLACFDPCLFWSHLTQDPNKVLNLSVFICHV